MTEAEWLVCTDLVEMIRAITKPGDSAFPHPTRISDAQLRLWVETCREEAGIDHLVFDINTDEGLRKTRAAILRDIVGNPWHPVVLPHCCVVCDCERYEPEVEYAACANCGRDMTARRHCTPTVLALARAAHEKRVTRKCKRCMGTGVVGKQLGRRVRDVDAPCSDCKGTGTFPSAELDRNRLLILADALEEAGVEDVPCPNCKDADFFVGDSGIPMMGGEEPYATRAKAYWNSKCICGGTRKPANPILAHLRGPGPHWRGCAVMTAILGES